MSKSPVILAGGSGFIGSHLARHLSKKDYEVRILSRRAKKNAKPMEYHWDPQRREIDQSALTANPIVINMAGANISSRRWTKQYKKRILDSRVESTRWLAQLLQTHPIRHFIQFSGVGIYGNHGDEWIDESTPIHIASDDFLARVCREWENAAPETKQKTILRIPPVLAADSGLIEQFRKSSRGGIVGILGDGRQYMPWIHIHDLVHIIVDIMEGNAKQPIINACAPEPITNSIFTKELKKTLGIRGLTLPIPKPALRIVLGPISYELTKSQRAHSAILSKTEFHYPELRSALSSLD